MGHASIIVAGAVAPDAIFIVPKPGLQLAGDGLVREHVILVIGLVPTFFTVILMLPPVIQ